MSIYDKSERNTEAKDKVEFVEVAEVKEPDLRPTCRAHGLGMSPFLGKRTTTKP